MSHSVRNSEVHNARSVLEFSRSRLSASLAPLGNNRSERRQGCHFSKDAPNPSRYIPDNQRARWHVFAFYSRQRLTSIQVAQKLTRPLRSTKFAKCTLLDLTYSFSREIQIRSDLGESLGFAIPKPKPPFDDQPLLLVELG